MTIKGVTIGDKFKQGKHIICEVVDILEKKSIKTGEIVGHICIVKAINSLATNEFDVPFTTVLRNKIN